LKTVIIIDDDLVYNAKLVEDVNKHSDFNVVAEAISGRDGKLLIEHYKPDVIIMDIIMPDDDGLNVIKHIYGNYENYNPYLFVITAINTSSMKAMLQELEVDFIEFKPLNEDSLVSILDKISSDTERPKKNYARRINKRDLSDVMEDVLLEIGMSPELFGYVCVKTALFFILDNPDERPKIYEKMPIILNVSKHSVDKNIRRAASTCIGSDLYLKLFGKHSVNNLKFLYGLAIYIEKRMRGSESR